MKGYYDGKIVKTNDSWEVKYSSGILGELKEYRTIPIVKEQYHLCDDLWKLGEHFTFYIEYRYVEPDASIHSNRGNDMPFAKIFIPTYKDFQLFEWVKISSMSSEVFKVVGIREDQLELEGDWSQAYNIIQKDWHPIHKIRKYTK